jgi:hypothetical protein
LFVVVKYERGAAKLSRQLMLPEHVRDVSAWLDYLMSECVKRKGKDGATLSFFDTRKRKGSSGGGGSSRDGSSAAGGGGVGGSGGGGGSRMTKLPKTTATTGHLFKAPHGGKGRRATRGDGSGDDSALLTSEILDMYALRPLTLHENVHRLFSASVE